MVSRGRGTDCHPNSLRRSAKHEPFTRQYYSVAGGHAGILDGGLPIRCAFPRHLKLLCPATQQESVSLKLSHLDTGSKMEGDLDAVAVFAFELVDYSQRMRGVL